MIEVRHLKTLQAIRDTGSMIEAAERVHLTQSALSHQLKELEHRLNVTLLVRKSRPLKFTSAGQVVLRLADEVLPKFRAAHRDLQKLAGGEAGRLHIAIECHSCFQWLMPSIDAYRSNWPEVELDLSSGFNFDPLPALQQSQLDLVITSDPTPLSGITYLPLFRYEALLAVSHQDELAKKSQIEPQDLANKTLITYPVDHERLDVFRDFLDPAKVKPKEVRQAELTVMMMQLVASGRGVCCLPNWALAEYLQRDYIKAVRLGENGLWSTLYAAVRDESANAPYIEDFVQCAQETSFSNLEGVKAVEAE